MLLLLSSLLVLLTLTGFASKSLVVCMCVGVGFTRAWAAEQWLYHWRKWLPSQQLTVSRLSLEVQEKCMAELCWQLSCKTWLQRFARYGRTCVIRTCLCLDHFVPHTRHWLAFRGFTRFLASAGKFRLCGDVVIEFFSNWKRQQQEWQGRTWSVGEMPLSLACLLCTKGEDSVQMCLEIFGRHAFVWDQALLKRFPSELRWPFVKLLTA